MSTERSSAAIIEAGIDADLAEQRLAEAEAKDYGWNSPEANELLDVMREATATIRRCADRMKTCKPTACFAYAAHITKAKHKFTWADNSLRRYA